LNFSGLAYSVLDTG